ALPRCRNLANCARATSAVIGCSSWPWPTGSWVTATRPAVITTRPSAVSSRIPRKAGTAPSSSSARRRRSFSVCKPNSIQPDADQPAPALGLEATEAPRYGHPSLQRETVESVPRFAATGLSEVQLRCVHVILRLRSLQFVL